MSRPDTPDTPGPEVPEEFAATYAEAYRRALESGEYDELDTGIHPVVVDPDSLITEVEPQQVSEVGTHRPAGPVGSLRDAPWFLPVLIGVAAVLLIAAAYGLGRAISGGSDDPSTGDATDPSSSAQPTREPAPSEDPTVSSTPAAGAYDGPADVVVAERARASCTSRPGSDSAGRPVRYRAANTLDDDPTTAWRCGGDAVGETLRFRFESEVDLVEVGLIPGYAKTDPASGVDRYAENNRITRVRWTFADGESVEQTLDGDADDRGVQTMRVPRTTTDEVTLEILAVDRGPRNTTAISSVAFAEAS